MARKGGNSGLACLFWEKAQLLGSGPDGSLRPGSCSGRGVPTEVSPIAPYTCPSSLSPACGVPPGVPAEGASSGSPLGPAEGRGFASLQVRSEVNHPEAGVEWAWDRGSGPRGSEWPGSSWSGLWCCCPAGSRDPA